MFNKRSRVFLTTVMVSQLVAASLALTSVSFAQDEAKTKAGDSTTEPKAAEHKARPHIDLAFCIDTTGSMQNEIDNVKAKVKETVAKIAGGKPAPIIRVGLVAYRDRGDDYVTKLFQFTDDIDKVVRDVSSFRAQGGGDGPESVNEALHVAVNDLNWDKDKKTLKMLFLIGDAGPHYYANDYDWHTESKKAISNGIQISTLACQGLESYPENEGTGVFKEIAKLTDGQFEQLTYRQEIVSAGGKRETIVTSGGAAYRVHGAGDSWRAGATALKSAHMADELSPSAVAGMAMSAPTRAKGMVSGALMRGATTAAAPMAMEEGYGGIGGGGGGSRRDSNLSDVVLNATKAAANKKLKMDFKE
jgi:hypothetical protein